MIRKERHRVLIKILQLRFSSIICIENYMDGTLNNLVYTHVYFIFAELVDLNIRVGFLRNKSSPIFKYVISNPL